MKHLMVGTALGAMLVLGGLTAAQADTWVFRDTLRPSGHDRSKAVKRADFRRCGATGKDPGFTDTSAPNMRECMFARGWTLDHIIPDPPSAHARSGYDSPSAVNPPDDDWASRQRDMDNTQQMLNQQNFFNQQAADNQQLQDQQQMQQQRQNEEIMNEHYNANQ
jgi:hypothetical protein